MHEGHSLSSSMSSQAQVEHTLCSRQQNRVLILWLLHRSQRVMVVPCELVALIAPVAKALWFGILVHLDFRGGHPGVPAAALVARPAGGMIWCARLCTN